MRLEKKPRKRRKFPSELDEEGVVIKADTIGGLEALAFELKKIEVPIRRATNWPGQQAGRYDSRICKQSFESNHSRLLG